MSKSIHISISLENGETVSLEIYTEKEETVLRVIHPEDASKNGEAPYQLEEGKIYEYRLTEGYRLERSGIVRMSPMETHRGSIHTNIYVGTLAVNVYRDEDLRHPVGNISLEICSRKMDYQNDYRDMLTDITRHCTDLLLRQSSPVSQSFKGDIHHDSRTLYQRFVFVESLVRSESFADALHRIQTMPVKRWETVERSRNISNIRRVNRSVMRQIITSPNRITLHPQHALSDMLGSLPNHVNIVDKQETTDTPENRFIKYVLETFLHFTLLVHQHKDAEERLKQEALATSELLEKYLAMPVFKEVSRLDIIPLNSPILQRKEGYREVLQAYLMYDMAASLVWKGGEEVYRGGKKDVAVLYEYWLFFQLLELIEDVFGVKSLSLDHLIQPTDEQTLELKLRRGELKMVAGSFVSHHRKYNLEFYYNRTFGIAGNYPDSGSWTRKMRPDYTLSIWPDGLSQEQAEERETIVHLHFDAKYRIDAYKIFNDIDPGAEKEQQKRGVYKRADLMIMHAYKDAIRRTAGSYILYPGSEEANFSSFHEILPGLGAFAVSPSTNYKAGLKQFLEDVVLHLGNRTSQREQHSYHIRETFCKEPEPAMEGILPIDNDTLFPHTTFVLVGYYKSQQYLEWILKNKLYTTRTGNDKGALPLSRKTTEARYLLLHTRNELVTNRIYELSTDGPEIITKELLEGMAYPSSSKDIKPYYLGYRLASDTLLSEEFGHVHWDIRKLPGYETGWKSGYPFVVTLEELMKGKCK
ncbi:MAG: DUF2357 domain-containing protein [Candidatus Azobacteroides sp.]|nr:DUF2357 domain-containing protein [Candidatus Azobacteroides sp.]